MTNIFRIAASGLGSEDRFTALLHYLIDSIPSIGQEIVDVICHKSGLAPTAFEMAMDHPDGDAENKPDFLLSCKEFNILCEHKLDSDLGDRQLERYLGLPNNRPTYLVLITNRSHDISEDVIKANNYLRPKKPLAPFFYWEDFYPTIANHSERLAQDFAGYMRDIGMTPCPLPEDWADLFRRRDVAEGFYDATMDMRNYFKEMGAQCKADPSRLGIQVHHPCKGIHLLYFYVDKSVKPAIAGVESPFLIARVYVRSTELGNMQNLNAFEIASDIGFILGREINERASWDKGLVLSYECVGSLNNYISGSMVEMRAKLLSFGKTVFKHVTITPNAISARQLNDKLQINEIKGDCP